jgi:hypothetical protein
MGMKYDAWCKENCPYYPDCYGAGVCNFVVSLLKEQEPKLPMWSTGRAYCPSCGERFPKKKEREINYCFRCGQAVKWE